MHRQSSTPIALAPRPASSASLRPSSSAPFRPPSSASAIRPSSSLGTSRPISRLSQRSGSRLSQRPSVRQASRIAPLTRALVTQITGITLANDADNFRIATDYVTKNLESSIGGSSGQHMAKMDQHFHGLAKKARIQSHDQLAKAIELAYKNVKERVQKNVDLDADIKISRLPDHLQLLVLLSLPPEQSTLEFAESYLENITNPRLPHRSLTWQDILAEEPFEGQHWEGAYGLPPGSTVEKWENESNGSTVSLSPWDDDSDHGEDSLSFAGSSPSPQEDHDAPLEPELRATDDFTTTKVTPQSYSHRDAVEQLKGRQYWRPEWRVNTDVTRPFNLGDPSTLGPSIHVALSEDLTLKFDGPEKEKYIYEHDAVREVLMGLQNHENLLMVCNEIRSGFFCYKPCTSPRLLHLTIASQISILSSFASTATVLRHLRRFVSTVFNKAAERSSLEDKVSSIINLRRRNSRTLEALADAIDSEIRQFDRWCSAREEEICKAHAGLGQSLVVSFLSLEKSIRDTFSSTFVVLTDVLQTVMKRVYSLRWSHNQPDSTQQPQIWHLTEIQNHVPPSVVTSILLNTLLQFVQEYSSMGDIVTSNGLMRVFAQAAEPVWTMIGQWLKNGTPIHDIATATVPSIGTIYGDAGAVDDEFFVEDNEIDLLDPDFWTQGYTLREHMDQNGTQATSDGLPVFISHVADDVLSTGKAIGLLRALGDTGVFQGTTGSGSESVNGSGRIGMWMDNWRTFGSMIGTSAAPHGDHVQVATTSTDVLSCLVLDELHPHCLAAQEMLTKVLVEDCDLWLHLCAMADCYLMRRGDAVSHFLDMIFTKMDSCQSWTDFHFLNTAFRDIAEASPKKWIDPSLVRLSYRGDMNKVVTRSVKGIDPLLVEYAVPFPLTYIFGPKTVQNYSSVFVWLVQIKWAQSMLESILLRGAGGVDGAHQQSELKVFYAMRSRLSWFINTLLNFVSTYVIHAEVLQFHMKLRKAKSLDDIISLHDGHLENIRSKCLLLPNTSALHRAILSILDMSLHFTDCFVAFAGDSTHDISRQSLLHMKRHRSKRLKRQRRDVVGFSTSIRELEDTSDSDSDSDVEVPLEPSFSYAASTTISFVEESFLSRVDKMSSELDGLVRFIRRGVESLAGGSGAVAPTFGILAFNLEDWDRG